MTFRYILYGPEESQIPVSWKHEAETWFRPVVDTFEHRIIAHQCVSRPTGSPTLAIRSAATQSRRGLYFLELAPSLIGDPEIDLSSAVEATSDSGLQPGNLVFEMV